MDFRHIQAAIEVKYLGARAKSSVLGYVVRGKWVWEHPENAGILTRANQKPWSNMEPGRSRGVQSYEAILILHVLEDK